jgi:hypothetical protein
VPALDQSLAVGIAALGRVGQRRRGIAVHHHLAGDHAGVAALGLGEEGFGRLAMHRAIDRSRRRPVRQQLVEQEARQHLGLALMRQLLLLDEGVLVEPLHQLGAIGRDHLRLRHVQMRIDEARHDQIRAVVDDLGASWQCRHQFGRFAHRLDHPAREHEQPVDNVAMCRLTCRLRIVDEPEQSSAKGTSGGSFNHGRRLRLKSRSYLH